MSGKNGKKVLWVSQEAWEAADAHSKDKGMPLTDAASALLLAGRRRKLTLRRHKAAKRSRAGA